MRSGVNWLVLVLSGCQSESRPGLAEIWIDVSPVVLGERVVAEDAGPLRFDLMLSNRGLDPLLIDGIEVSGDSTCAFTFEGPDLLEVYPEETSFLRGWYQPTALGEHQIALTIFSNAGNFPELVVPICGRGVEEVRISGDIACQIPPETQPDCPE